MIRPSDAMPAETLPFDVPAPRRYFSSNESRVASVVGCSQTETSSGGPSTAQLTSKKSASARSTSTCESRVAAAARASVSSSSVRHRRTPMLLPRCTGFTITGSGAKAAMRARAAAGSAWRAARSRTRHSSTGTSCARATCLVIALFMPMADASTSAPT
jgi:hypothetical protein